MVLRVLQVQLQVYYSIKSIIVAMIKISLFCYSNCSTCSSRDTNSRGVHYSDNNLQAMRQTYVVSFAIRIYITINNP